ncbi:MAG: rhodanese-like domain-containing protein [Chloroflexota bacterium]|nr:rhodanese-like domain-containing protein [Chloroflexota bacterium]
MTTAQSELLTTTDWLADHLDGVGTDFALIDAGEAVAYRRAHIPGAVGLPHPYLKGRENSRLVMTAPEFESLMGRLGVSNETPVVIYDDNASLHAARVWWVFEHFGHRDVRVVDGGLNAWLHEGRALTSAPARPEAATFEARVDRGAHCTVDELVAIVEAGPDAPDAPQIWDTRSDGEWDGSNDRGNARAGHVPGAKHLEWLRLMQGPPSRRFRPLDEIRELIEGAGIDPEAATVTY